MKKIELTQGKYALVDDEDFERVNKRKWCYDVYARRRQYLYTDNNKKQIYANIKMHRIILDTPKGGEIDHINGDKLDNRKLNLRICTRKENARNLQLSKLNTSGFKGVTFIKQLNRWRSRIGVDEKRIHLGYFDNKIEASRAYNKAALQYYGEFARLN